MPAGGACPRLTPLRRVISLERAVLVALRTVGRFPVWRVAGAPEPFQAGFVVGELAHELHEGARRFRGTSASRLEAVNWGHWSLLVGKRAVRALTRAAFALSKPNISDQTGQHPAPLRGLAWLFELVAGLTGDLAEKVEKVGIHIRLGRHVSRF